MLFNRSFASFLSRITFCLAKEEMLGTTVQIKQLTFSDHVKVNICTGKTLIVDQRFVHTDTK